MKDALGHDIDLIQGKGGIFDLKVDGELVYSKHETGVFPEHADIIAALKG